MNEVNTSQNASMPATNNMERNKRAKNNSNNKFENSNNSLSSTLNTSNRIRVKRKAGPLDMDSLNLWKYNNFFVFFIIFLGDAEGLFQVRKLFQILRLFAQIFQIYLI